MLHPGMEEPFWHLKPTKFCKNTAEQRGYQQTIEGLLEWVGDKHIKGKGGEGKKEGVYVGSRMSRGIDDRCTYTASSEMLHVHKLEKYKHTAYKVVSHLQLIMIMPYFPKISTMFQWPLHFHFASYTTANGILRGMMDGKFSSYSSHQP